MNATVRFLKRLFWWQNTVTEVRFITGEGVQHYLHVHPAWHGRTRIFEDALQEAMPEGFESFGKIERTE